MTSTFLDSAMLLTAPVVPAWMIFIWHTGHLGGNRLRRFRHAIVGYSLCLLVAGAFVYGLASHHRAPRPPLAMRPPLDRP